MIKTLLIIGVGSIGQRHAKNAKALGIEKIILADIDIERAGKFAKEIETDFIYQGYKKAVAENPEIEAGIVSTSSSFHIEPAKFLAERKINIFIEKPLSNNLKGTDNLIKIVKKNKVVVMMGQCYRFHKGFLKLKELLNKNTIGKIYHVNYFGGHYLPDWHPERDYRKEYTGQKKLGGGALLTSASHSFDIIHWLFGGVKDIIGWKAKLSNLEIDVEDSFFCLIKTEKDIIVQIQSDFLQRNDRHQMIITGEKGNIEADFIKNEIKVWAVGGRLIQTLKYDFESNRRYVDELNYFIELIDNKKTEHDLNLRTGKSILELILNQDIVSIDEK